MSEKKTKTYGCRYLYTPRPSNDHIDFTITISAGADPHAIAAMSEILSTSEAWEIVKEVEDSDAN